MSVHKVIFVGDVLFLQNFAHFKDGEQSCIPPCKKIEDGEMTLETCVDVNTTVVWTDVGHTPFHVTFSFCGRIMSEFLRFFRGFDV